MDIGALEVIDMAYVIIKLVLLVAGIQRFTTSCVSVKHPDYSNPRNFDIMRETK